MVGETRNPPTLIHRPFANAVSASDTTKLGKMEDINTTRDSPAKRSRKSHMTQVKKAEPPDRRLIRKYVMIEKMREIITVFYQYAAKVK